MTAAQHKETVGDRPLFPLRFLTETIFTLPKKLHQIVRWDRWVHQGAEEETVLEHTVSQSIISIIILEKLRSENRISDKTAYETLACSLLHDIGETEVGDILDYEKTDKDAKQERNSFDYLFRDIDSALHDRLLKLYDVQEGAKTDDDLDGQEPSTLAFGLAEKLCYLMYATRQDKKCGSNGYGADVLEHVVRRQSHGFKSRARKLGLDPDALI